MNRIAYSSAMNKLVCLHWWNNCGNFRIRWYVAMKSIGSYFSPFSLLLLRSLFLSMCAHASEQTDCMRHSRSLFFAHIKCFSLLFAMLFAHYPNWIIWMDYVRMWVINMGVIVPHPHADCHHQFVFFLSCCTPFCFATIFLLRIIWSCRLYALGRWKSWQPIKKYRILSRDLLPMMTQFPMNIEQFHPFNLVC